MSPGRNVSSGRDARAGWDVGSGWDGSSVRSGGVADPIEERWRAEWEASGRPGEEGEALVALSGGPDSTVLLHLLRFTPGLPELRLATAHFDHRMRPGSEADALWVAGLCRAWGVPLETGRADEPPGNEAEARSARYRFLERVARERESARILTAHHADDQAETVLYRALRGTGLGGLGGIPRRRGPILRPLLPFRREELEAYARRRGLRSRTDPTNLDLSKPRNLLRHRVLPAAEETVAPDPRGALVRLARLARGNERGWRSVLPALMEGVVDDSDEGRIVLVRPGFLGYHPHVRARVLRTLARRLGIRLDEAGTRAALQFTSSGRSGGRVDLGGGVILSREFETLVLRRAERVEVDDLPLEIPGPGEGSGEARIAGRRWRIRWSARGLAGRGISGSPEEHVGPAEDGPQEPEEEDAGREDAGARLARVPSDRVTFPLRVRAPQPGDRIRLEYGSKKVARLLAEARVPRSRRQRLPILVDAGGSVLWIPGVRTAHVPGQGETEPRLIIRIENADPD